MTGVSVPEDLLDFVVPDLHQDLQVGMCINLEFGKHHPNAHARAMYRTGCYYYGLVCAAAADAAAGSLEAEMRLRQLVELPEAKEIRFGYVGDGHDGNGVGAGPLSDHVRRYLKRHRSLRETLPEHPDALSIIPQIGVDRQSDSHATIVKLHLIHFTEEMAAKWHFDPACMREVDVPMVWDPISEQFITVRATLPVDDDGEPILLVPRKMVASAPPLSGDGYFDDVAPPQPGEPKRIRRSKDDALRDADASPGRLNDYAVARLERARPRRVIRRQLGE